MFIQFPIGESVGALVCVMTRSSRIMDVLLLVPGFTVILTYSVLRIICCTRKLLANV